jgi:hypothetical protein
MARSRSRFRGVELVLSIALLYTVATNFHYSVTTSQDHGEDAILHVQSLPPESNKKSEKKFHYSATTSQDHGEDAILHLQSLPPESNKKSEKKILQSARNYSATTSQDHGEDAILHVQSSLPPESKNKKSEKKILKSARKMVVLHPEESFMWLGNQARLCKRIRKEWEDDKDLVLSVRAPCDLIHSRHQHGNYVLGIYAMHVAAMAYEVEFQFQCSSRKTTQNIFWWLQTTTTTTNGTNSLATKLYDPPLPPKDLACRGMGKAPIHYMSERIRHDLRRMAVRIFGIRDEEMAQRYKGEYHIEIPPLFPEVDLDEVAIHFRCGDVLRNLGKNETNYGLVKFQTYRNHIDPESRQSIGIVTTPFDKKKLRHQDASFHKSCERITQKLVAYLSKHFPHAKVNIRNDPTDSLEMVYSRLILAKQNICVRSTFCLFPAIAAFGTSFVQEGGVAYFIPQVAQVYDNIQLMNGTVLRSYDISKRGIQSTIAWLLEEEEDNRHFENKHYEIISG